MDRRELKLDLMHQFGYSSRAAEIVSGQLLHSSPVIQEAFRAWRLSGTQPDMCVAGYTVDRLTHEHGMTAVAALLTLDWLIREPEKAVASLHRGHDHVVGRSRGEPGT